MYSIPHPHGDWRVGPKKKPTKPGRYVVLALTSNGDVFAGIAEWVERNTLTIDVFVDDDYPDDRFDLGEHGEKFVPEGWYECGCHLTGGYLIDMRVVAWTDIPRLPIPFIGRDMPIFPGGINGGYLQKGGSEIH